MAEEKAKVDIQDKIRYQEGKMNRSERKKQYEKVFQGIPDSTNDNKLQTERKFPRIVLREKENPILEEKMIAISKATRMKNGIRIHLNIKENLRITTRIL